MAGQTTPLNRLASSFYYEETFHTFWYIKVQHMDLRMMRYMMRHNNVIFFMDMRGLDVYGLDLERSICFSVVRYCYLSLPTQE